MSKKKSKKKIPILQDLSSDSQKMFNILNEESDLACVLIGTSFLDQCLASMLERYFIEDKDISDSMFNPSNNGALSTFSSRNNLAYLLGLINEYIHKDLRTIGKIRNFFAHAHFEITFEDGQIQVLCNKLDYINKLEKRLGKEFLSSCYNNSRNIFTTTVALISQQLLLLGLSIKRKEKNTAFIQHLYNED
jgi:DNA-binding MltR family transcriptional regulator